MAANDKFMAANANKSPLVSTDLCIKITAMQKIETSIIINANTETIWNHLTDFSSYEKWNPFITKIMGDQNTGSKLKVSIKLENKKLQHFKPQVLTFKSREEFRWKGKLFFKGLFDGEHYFKLVKLSPNETRFVHGEKFTGILVPMIMKMIKEDTLNGFNTMNSSLKKVSES